VHVIATAGHVDHGKSTLVRALTGMEPDRWSEERRRGMTIDLGFAWTTLASGEEIAFVDVPGHERFTTNMLAGVGPVPASLLVVAADGGWSPQTTEHVAALDALGVSHAVLAVTRSDLADPEPVIADARRRLSATSLGAVEAVAVSAPTGYGLDDLAAALGRMVRRLPPPDLEARVRLWVDRAFTMRGFGTVLTGTLGAGRVAVGDTLELGEERVVVRGLESLGQGAAILPAIARVALNLRAVPRAEVRRGQVLLTPGAWHWTDTIDVRLTTGPPTEPAPPARPLKLPRQLVLHIGSAAVPVSVRALDSGHLRLGLGTPLPLQIGDRALLRHPGLRQVVAGLVVLDPAPPTLAPRGAARRRAVSLAGISGGVDVAGEVERRQVVSRELLDRLGVGTEAAPEGVVEKAGWLIAAPQWAEWTTELGRLVEAGDGRDDRLVHEGVSRAEAVRQLGLPDPALLGAVVAAHQDLELADGQVRSRRRGRVLDPALTEALRPIVQRLSAAPFDAPAASDLAAAGLHSRRLAAAAAVGVVLVLPGDVVVAPDAPRRAAEILARLPQPFTMSEARQALATSRKVAVPLLEHLDRAGATRRVDENRRRVTGREPGRPGGPLR
jgi:selenocysteine-specific elongation factor